MEFLKFIAIFFIGYYVIKYLFRLLMPFAMRKMAEKLMHKAQQSQGRGSFQYTTGGSPFEHFKQERTKKEGEIKVDYVPQEDAKMRKGPQTAGEFVEFEEIK